MKIKSFWASFQTFLFFLHPSKKKRDNKEEKGLGMMIGMTLFSFKKVGHWDIAPGRLWIYIIDMELDLLMRSLEQT